MHAFLSSTPTPPQIGDSAEIHLEEGKVPSSVETKACEDGDHDFLYGGPGVDYIIGGSYNDTIEGNEGMDMVFGDHGLILFNTSHPYMLKYATTMNATCTPGSDNITLGEGDDIAFGGGFGDDIDGGEGQDIILGDFGLYNAEVEFLPNQHYESIIDYPHVAGPDVISGGAGDDILMGQEVRAIATRIMTAAFMF